MPSLLIEAGPGSGKTFTVSAITSYLRATNKSIWLKQNPRLTPEQLRILYWCEENLGITPKSKIIGMAYNKEAADQLAKKTHPTVECRSVHGWGYKIINKAHGYVKINQNRSIVHVERITGKAFNSLKDKWQWIASIRYFEKLKDELLEPSEDNIFMLSSKYDDLASFKPHKDMVNHIRQLIPYAVKVETQVGIEYIDQVWLASFMLKKPMFDLAIVDECQDISPARRELCSRIAENVIWIGDRYQAINAFAGADPYSIQEIAKLVDKQLPLKTSFRCPPNVIRKLNAQYPKAKLVGLDKPEGKEVRLPLSKVPSVIENDVTPSNFMVICRTNAPLIRAAYVLLQQEIPCRITGDRVVDHLVKIAERVKGSSLDEYKSNLHKYKNRISGGLQDYVKELFQDKVKCIELVLEHCATPEDVPKELRKLLKPSHKEHVTLSTIHKAKGTESPNVMILFPPIESPKANTDEQRQQEANLRYVAESRTSNNVYWVVEDDE